MCGIAGKFDFRGNPIDRQLIERMCATIAHRGPDDEGIHIEPHVALAQRRLAIIDLDRRGTAPLSNEDGTIWITFNGEIYNYRELREQLLQKGHTFRTGTDTEVIVHLYEENGVECVQQLRGMFAFAIWDAKRQQFFAARDRLGKKPFLYARTPNALVFGSAIKAVLTDPDVSVAPDYGAIDDYLSLQYVPSPATAFAGIEKLAPAHRMVCGTDGVVHVERYWAPPVGEKTRASEDEICDGIMTRLREAVRLRMIADVPLGAFLSGGIDSATVVALMAEQSSSPVKTFSIGFDEQEFNELSYARLVAQRYGTDHHELIVRADAAEVLPLLVTHFGEPFADSSAIPTYYVSKMTREHVTVALSGDGGDENFAGYGNYAAVLGWSRADAIPAVLRNMTVGTFGLLLRALPPTTANSRARRGLAMLAGNVSQRFRLQTSILKPEEKAAAYTSQFRALIGRRDLPVQQEWNERMDALDWMMRHDQNFYLADCLNVKVDVASMANSLEVRSPLLDHEMIEYTSTIPSAMKRDAAGGKAIFKRAVRDLLPPEILTKRKTGFGLPVAAWLRGPLQPLLRANLLDDKARRRRLIEPRFMQRIIDDHVAGRRDWSSRLWAFLFLEMWFREFID